MKKALIVVDFQNDFITGTLGFPKALTIREAIVNKIQNTLSQGQDLIFTYDTHYENYLETQEGKKLPISHCIEGTWGWELDSSVLPFKEKATAIFKKNTFGSMNLGQFLLERGYDEVELCGLVTSICVFSNAVIAKAALPEAKIIVDSSCTEDTNAEVKDCSLRALQGIMIEVKNS
ncbi:MAG: cysteine hydrolase family protein [Sphaerochaetaceae bacterium]|nr:cysteine hydrolase family protein [Sphaerochaetaceae bacterium]